MNHKRGFSKTKSKARQVIFPERRNWMPWQGKSFVISTHNKIKSQLQEYNYYTKKCSVPIICFSGIPAGWHCIHLKAIKQNHTLAHRDISVLLFKKQFKRHALFGSTQTNMSLKKKNDQSIQFSLKHQAYRNKEKRRESSTK